MAKKPTPLRDALAERIRVVLDDRTVREVPMFGGLSFMVADRLVVSVNAAGQLLVRCAPEDVDDLVAEPGVAWAQMRARPMSRGWIRVDADALTGQDAVARWVRRAVAHAESLD